MQLSSKTKKKKKTRSIKTKRPLVENIKVHNIILYPTGNLFWPLFTETATKLREIR